MNGLVGVRMNSSGLFSVSREKRAETAEKTAATYLAKIKSIMAKAGVAMEDAGSAAAASSAKSADAKAASGAKAASEDEEENSSTRNVKKELDKDAFLQLMVLQMQNQDPMSPMDNVDMIAQLAQFSSLEQMNNLNDSFDSLAGAMSQLNFTAANGFLGKTVTGLNTDGEKVTGKVDRVTLDSGSVYLIVGSARVPVDSVVNVQETATEKTTAKSLAQ